MNFRQICPLTTGIDTVTSATQIVNGIIDQTASDTNTTWSLSDTIAPAAGGTLNLSLLSKSTGGDGADGMAGYNTTNATTLNIRSVDQFDGASTPSFDLGGFAGLTKVSVANSSVVGTTADTLTLSGIKSTTAVDINTNGQNQNVKLTGADWTGAADTLTLTAAGRSGNLTLGTGIETVAITTTDAAARLGALTSQTTATNKTVTVAGEGLRIDAVLDSTITSFDASKSTGPVNVFLAPGSTLTSAKGGTGTADVLAVNALGTTQTISGFEKVQAQASGTYNLANVTGATTLGVDAIVSGTIAATFTNAAATTNTISVSGGAQRTTAANATNNLVTGNIDYSLKTATGTSDSVTLALDNGGVASTSTTSGTLTVGKLTTNAIETVNVTLADWKTVTLTNGLKLDTVTSNSVATVSATGTSAINFGVIDLSSANGSTSAGVINFGGMTGNTTATLTDTNSLTYTGGSAVDTITNGAVAAGKTQTFNLGAGNDAGNLIAVANDTTAVVAMNGEAGDDAFNAGFALTQGTFSINGGDGTDTLNITANGIDVSRITTITSIEKIQAQGTANIIDGAAVSGQTIEVTSFSTGANRLNVTAAASGATVDLSKFTFSGPNEGLVINGGAGVDAITGTSKADTIVGGASDDTITAGDGADTITGDAGVDTITGGEGADTVTVGSGQDSVTLTESTAAIDTVAFATAFATGNTNAATITGFANGAGIDLFDVGFNVSNGTTAATSALVAIAPVTTGDNGTATANDVIFLLSGANDQMAASSTASNAVANAVTALTSTTDFSSANIATADSLILVLDDGTNSFVFHYIADGTAAITAAADLELIAIINGVSNAGTFITGDFT